MNSAVILASNERLLRINALAEASLNSREFPMAIALFEEKIRMLREFRYVNDLELAKAYDMLAFTHECHNEFEKADEIRKQLQDFLKDGRLKIKPVEQISPSLTRKQRPSLQTQMRVIRTA